MSSWWRLRRERPRGRRGTWKGLLPWFPEAPDRRPGHWSSPCQPGVLAWLVETVDPHLDSVPETLPRWDHGERPNAAAPPPLRPLCPCHWFAKRAGGGRREAPGARQRGAGGARADPGEASLSEPEQEPQPGLCMAAAVGAAAASRGCRGPGLPATSAPSRPRSASLRPQQPLHTRL